MYRHISQLLVVLCLSLLLGQTLVLAQDEPTVHMISVSWDSPLTELSLDLGVTTTEGVYCNLSMIVAGDDCDQIVSRLGNPQLSLTDNPQFAILEWQELSGYNGYSVCV